MGGPIIENIGCDADYCQPRRRIVRATDAEALAEWALFWPVELGQFLIHDGDGLRGFAIVGGETPASLDLHAHELQIGWSDALRVCPRGMPQVGRDASFDLEVSPRSPVVAERVTVERRYGFDAGKRRKIVQRLAIENKLVRRLRIA